MAVDTFVSASSIDEVLEALAGGARVVAGGTDLVVLARQGKAPLPSSLVAVHRVEALRGIAVTEAGVRLGALATHAEVVENRAIRDRFTALADASAVVGSHATRAHGTVGGNLMNASPAMDTGGPLVCLGATAALVSSGGARELPVAELFLRPGQTRAAADELLTAVDIPQPAAGTGSCYLRLEYRRAMEIAIVGATAVVTLARGCVTEARIAITALAPTIHRVADAEALLVGSDGGLAAAEAAGSAAAAAASPISDVRASADYRRAMAAVITRRAIYVAVTRAGGGTVSIPASAAREAAG